jgi:hypothetical protein
MNPKFEQDFIYVRDQQKLIANCKLPKESKDKLLTRVHRAYAVIRDDRSIDRDVFMAVHALTLAMGDNGLFDEDFDQ